MKDVTLTSEPDNILEKEVFEKLRKLGMSVVKIKRPLQCNNKGGGR